MPGPGFVVLLRLLCGPGLSTNFQGNLAEQGSQTWKSFPFTEKYVWAHKHLVYKALLGLVSNKTQSEEELFTITILV